MKKTRFIKFITGLAAVASIGLSAQAAAADTYTWKGGKKASNNDRYYWDDTHSSSRYQWTKGSSDADWPTSQTTTSNAPDVILSSSGSNHDKVWAHDKAIIAGNVSVEAADYVITMYIQKDEDVKGDIEKWTRMQFKSLALKASNLTVTSNTDSERVASPMLQLGKLTNTVNASLTLNTVSTVAAEATEVAAGTTLTIAGDSTSAGSLGVLTLGEGSTLAVTNSGANFTLGTSGQTSTLANGAKLSLTGGKTYTLNGTFAVTINDSQGGSGMPAENGFVKASYNIQVVEGNATSTAQWTINGMEAQYKDGYVTAAGVFYDTYYVVNGEATARDINTAAQGHESEFKTVALSAGELVLDATLSPAKLQVTGGSISMAGGSAEGTVSLDNYTLNITGNEGSLTFTGGTLAKGAKFHFDGNATYTLSGLYEVQGGTAGGGGIVIPTSNGFATGDFSATVVEGNATNNASWKLNGMTASYNNGTITASGTLYDTYYIVQSGSTVSVSSITQAAGQHASELKQVVLNAGTLDLNANLEATLVAKGGTVDAGTSTATRRITAIDLQADAAVTFLGGGTSGSSTVTINVDNLNATSGNAQIWIGRYGQPTSGDNNYHTKFAVGNTTVGAGNTLTVRGQASEDDTTLGAITLGANSTLELAGHRKSGSGNNFKLKIGVSGGQNYMADGSKIVINPRQDGDGASGESTAAVYTLLGTFNVTGTQHGDIAKPTGNGFATATFTATVLQNNVGGMSGNVGADVVTDGTSWYLNGEKATYKYSNNVGTISVQGANVYDTWYQKSGTTSITEIMTAAGDGASLVSTVELSGGELTVDGDIATVNATGGTVYVASKEYKIDSLNVNDDTKVAGDVDSSVVGIASGKTASFTEGLKAGGVEYASPTTGGVQVRVTNNGQETQTYDISKADMSVTAATLTKVVSSIDVTDMNKFEVSSIINQAGGTLWLAGMSQGETIEVNELTIGNASTVKITEGVEDQAQELTVKVADTLTVNGGTLLANLELRAGSTLNLGGGTMNLGSELTLQEGLIQLDEATLEAIKALENIGDKHNLIYSVSGTELTYGGKYDGDWARVYFDLTSIENGDYKLMAKDNVFAIVKSSNVPEPTTGTLSLLALCALAARRRRK